MYKNRKCSQSVQTNGFADRNKQFVYFS